MKTLKQILQETGEYQETPVKRAHVPERVDPPKPKPKKWTTVGEIIEEPGEYAGAVGRWIGKILKDFWNSIVGRIESLVRKCRV